MSDTRERRRQLARPTVLTGPEIREATDGLGDQLKAMFDSVASEPLPHELVDLVEALEGGAKRRPPKRTH